jgi:hypothetical protein
MVDERCKVRVNEAANLKELSMNKLRLAFMLIALGNVRYIGSSAA